MLVETRREFPWRPVHQNDCGGFGDPDYPAEFAVNPNIVIHMQPERIAERWLPNGQVGLFAGGAHGVPPRIWFNSVALRCSGCISGSGKTNVLTKQRFESRAAISRRAALP